MKIISILSFLVMTMPFMGFPEDWKTTFFVIAGLWIFLKSLSLRNKFNIQKNNHSSYKENNNINEK
jgi:hypothetical protein